MKIFTLTLFLISMSGCSAAPNGIPIFTVVDGESANSHHYQHHVGIAHAELRQDIREYKQHRNRAERTYRNREKVRHFRARNQFRR